MFMVSLFATHRAPPSPLPHPPPNPTWEGRWPAKAMQHCWVTPGDPEPALCYLSSSVVKSTLRTSQSWEDGV